MVEIVLTIPYMEVFPANELLFIIIMYPDSMDIYGLENMRTMPKSEMVHNQFSR